MQSLLNYCIRNVEGEAENTFQVILAAALEIPQETINVDDGFYHLGGDSMSPSRWLLEPAQQVSP
ncbi:acyl carrier protein [Aspergillus foveolatus]|uniref:acyl carrier protein n=1 Tax=Aspergillus foveolatus TaxID=210207 RepID=UPI003CCE33F6